MSLFKRPSSMQVAGDQVIHLFDGDVKAFVDPFGDLDDIHLTINGLTTSDVDEIVDLVRRLRGMGQC